MGFGHSQSLHPMYTGDVIAIEGDVFALQCSSDCLNYKEKKDQCNQLQVRISYAGSRVSGRDHVLLNVWWRLEMEDSGQDSSSLSNEDPPTPCLEASVTPMMVGHLMTSDMQGGGEDIHLHRNIQHSCSAVATRLPLCRGR
jgi:hypothetical protein